MLSPFSHLFFILKEEMLLGVLVDLMIQTQLASVLYYMLRKSGATAPLLSVIQDWFITQRNLNRNGNGNRNLQSEPAQLKYVLGGVVLLVAYTLVLMFVYEHTWSLVLLLAHLDFCVLLCASKLDSSVVSPSVVFWDKFFGHLEQKKWQEILLSDHTVAWVVALRALRVT